ncbi:MAG: hypothetical protein C0518_03110 [Opitutus sp.]|nr:hypothetical protein [Opitutus sp.]
MQRFIFALLVFYIGAYAQADSWPPPKLKVVSSPDGNTLLRVTPAFGTEENRPAVATVLTYDPATEGYKKRSEFRLRNPQAPHDALVTNDARFIVTFDDYAALGRTENVVVVYRGDGEFVKAWALSEIFTSEERLQFERSTSSTWWRKNFALLDNQGRSPVVVLELLSDNPIAHRTLEFDVGKLTFTKR